MLGLVNWVSQKGQSMVLFPVCASGVAAWCSVYVSASVSFVRGGVVVVPCAVGACWAEGVSGVVGVGVRVSVFLVRDRERRSARVGVLVVGCCCGLSGVLERGSLVPFLGLSCAGSGDPLLGSSSVCCWSSWLPSEAESSSVVSSSSESKDSSLLVPFGRCLLWGMVCGCLRLGVELLPGALGGGEGGGAPAG
jgi:hypothetical protein